MAAAILAAIGLMAAGGASANAPPEGITPEGVWRNPHDTVHIELKPCGTEVCGFVIWASESAEKAGRKTGHPTLVGLQLLRDFVVGPDRVGRGKVYVPDLNATFAGTAVRLDARTLKAKGCLIANLVCKTQIWTRVDAAAG